MALDEALLRCGGPPTLRLYGWQPAGLSLGYFQSSKPFANLAGEYVLVRRLTGGGAIYHQSELTFCLTLDGELLPGNVEASYHLIHAAVGLALADIGVPTREPFAAEKEPCLTASPWCFADPCGLDLVVPSGKKILGSAQRRIRQPSSRIMHHGSIVLEAPEVTPFCGAVAEHADPKASAPKLQEQLIHRLAAALDLTAEAGALSAREQQLATELSQDKYGLTGFSHQR